MDELSWVPSSFQILRRNDGYISGIVNSDEELENLLENHKRVTLTSFLKWSDNSKDSSKRRFLWQVEDYSQDTPLCVTRRIILSCRHGKAPCRRTCAAQDHSLERTVTKKRIRIKKVKKLNCPAKLFIRHVRRYDSFSVKGDASRAKKEDAMRRLKEELTRSDPPTSAFIHVRLPLVDAHQNHTIASGCCFSRSIHPKVNVKCARELCTPHEGDQAYFPSDATIQKHINMGLVEKQTGPTDGCGSLGGSCARTDEHHDHKPVSDDAFSPNDELSWVPSSFKILKRSDGYISGIVDSEEELKNLLENHKRATLTSFLKWSEKSKNSSKLRFLWQVEDYSEETPLCVTRREILTCRHGKASCRRPSAARENSLEQTCTKKRIRAQKVKKLDCPAKLFIRHVKRYDSFSVKGDSSRAKKEDAMRRLKEELTRSDPPTSEFIHVRLPLVEAHQNHAFTPK
ncbi:uncharacterized protein V6R79_013745 [Siganus canaliculatus]